MLLKSHKPSVKQPGVFVRLFRSIFTVLILSTLVVFIILLIKELNTLNTQRLISAAQPLLAKVHINLEDERVGRAGEVAGKFVEKISQTNLGSGVSDVRKEPKLVIAVASDVHEDIENLRTTLKLASEGSAKVIIFLGDMTNYGDVPSLTQVKEVLDEFKNTNNIAYYVLPGDHDLAQTSDLANFEKVFGTSNRILTLDATKLYLFNDSANFTPFSDDELETFKTNVADADFLLLSQPLYTTGLNMPFSKMYLGSTLDTPEDSFKLERQKQVLAQRDQMLNYIQNNTKLQAVLSGDHHRSSVTEDSTKKELKHVVVGAVTRTVNDMSQKAIQLPRFTLLKIYDDNTFEVEDVLIK